MIRALQMAGAGALLSMLIAAALNPDSMANPLTAAPTAAPAATPRSIPAQADDRQPAWGGENCVGLAGDFNEDHTVDADDIQPLLAQGLTVVPNLGVYMNICIDQVGCGPASVYPCCACDFGVADPNTGVLISDEPDGNVSPAEPRINFFIDRLLGR